MDNLNVIIPVFKPTELFADVLRSVYNQTFSPKRIILMWTVPDESTRSEEEKKAEKFCSDRVEVIFVLQSEFDHGGTRRRAMELSDSEFAVCMTQDCTLYDENVFNNLYNAFDDKTAAAYARQLPYDDCFYAEKIVRQFNYPDNERTQNKDTLAEYGIKTYFCSNVCAMYKKSSYVQAGGFVKRTIFNEDMILAARLVDLGYSVKYVPAAKVLHSHNYTCMQQFKRNFDLAVSHREYYDIFSRVSSESEGVKMVITVIKKLIISGHLFAIPKFIMQSGFKYIGYKKGLNYTKLSKEKILKYTMNKSYWV